LAPTISEREMQFPSEVNAERSAAAIRGFLEAERIRDTPPVDFTLYQSGVHPDQDDARQFRDAHSVCDDDKLLIRFLGVWDTVGSLGIPLHGLRLLTRRKYQFHDTELSSAVGHGCHALAIDEYRRPFDPTLWAARPKEHQTIEQVWFCGAHSDVGGGYPTFGLSDITLEWMIDRAQSAGLVFDPEVLEAHPLRPDPRGTLTTRIRVSTGSHTVWCAWSALPIHRTAALPARSMHHSHCTRRCTRAGTPTRRTGRTGCVPTSAASPLRAPRRADESPPARHRPHARPRLQPRRNDASGPTPPVEQGRTG
jgi:hypothetical protein